MDPVDGQSLGGVELAVDEDHLLGRVTRFVDVGAAGTGGHRAPTRLPELGSRGSVADTGTLMVLCNLLLSPTASYFPISIWPHFHSREVCIS